ncbi:MAG TPA: ATP-binding protein [Candidatus Fermentibacter daniensis]|nr:putative DNA binding domain-containing protein [Candidatus Fermentibacter sp.]HOA05207.1 ATP-binding protein [Candidatus Fermentibacter daniensis]HOD19102.1 ATP-binding protein [Candidatus Fermentibacter daniensis]HOR07035.1 ATP-binding protein [Candidatus Fermentibacter daniensis]HOZ18542.1 ATP-binding protein [Candidatus Fermentibacter daniensis]
MTTPDQVTAWAASGESEVLEFKSSTAEKDRACRTLCAFANGRGGRVLFGVTPAGKVVGQTVSDHTLEELAQEFQGFEPPVFPGIERVAVEGGREVLVLSVSRSEHLPVTYRTVAYERVLNTTRLMPRETMRRLLLEEFHSVQRWENQPAEGWAVNRLDQREMTLTLEESIRRGRTDDPGTREPLEILRGLGLLVQGERISRAAVVLFCTNDTMQPDFPQLLLKVARFKGTTRDEFLDNRQFYGNAFTLMRHAERFLIDSLPVASRIVPGRMEREDTPLLPVEALRETLANAFVHRDYSIGGGSVSVALYDDRLEVISIGDLHFGLTPEALFRDHESRPWNPMIANIFYRRGIIENWGRGTLKIARLMREQGLEPPEVAVREGAVAVTFRIATTLTRETTGITTGKMTGKMIGKMIGKTPGAVLELLRTDPGLTVIELAVRLGKSEITIHRAVRVLREAGLLQRIGPDKGGYWKVLD